MSKKDSIKQRLNISLDGNDETEFVCKDCGLIVSRGYCRVVIGDRGPYIEFDPQNILMSNIEYQDVFHVYFHEYLSKCSHKVFVYFQRKTVSYADYVVGKFYIGPDFLSVNGEICIEPEVEKPRSKILF